MCAVVIDPIVKAYESGMITQSEFVEEILMAAYKARAAALSG